MRHIQKPVKHLKWSALRNYLVAAMKLDYGGMVASSIRKKNGC